jgi:hypothetical protein
MACSSLRSWRHEGCGDASLASGVVMNNIKWPSCCVLRKPGLVPIGEEGYPLSRSFLDIGRLEVVLCLEKATDPIDREARSD